MLVPALYDPTVGRSKQETSCRKKSIMRNVIATLLLAISVLPGGVRAEDEERSASPVAANSFQRPAKAIVYIARNSPVGELRNALAEFLQGTEGTYMSTVGLAKQRSPDSDDGGKSAASSGSPAATRSGSENHSHPAASSQSTWRIIDRSRCRIAHRSNSRSAQEYQQACFDGTRRRGESDRVDDDREPRGAASGRRNDPCCYGQHDRSGASYIDQLP